MANDQRGRDRHSIEFYVDLGEDQSKEIGYYCNKFEWTCFVNAGHRITVSFRDTHQHVLDKETINKLLEKAKGEDGLDVEVRIWQDYHRKTGKKSTKRRYKVLTLNSSLLGSLTEATLEIVAVDQASWYLNRGKCDGHAYQGNVTSVIQQIVKKYAPGIQAEVDDTKDDKNNWWWDMRLDPKTVISSLVEWSSKITKRETPLVIHCQDNEFKCREWAGLPPTKVNGKKFFIAHKDADSKEWTDRGELQILSNNLLAPAATRLYTASVSAITGLYIDKQNPQLDDRHKYADDKFTPGKLKPEVKSDQSYKKPTGEFSTLIEPVPEHNNGDVGLKYQDYSVGRARDWFIKTLYTTLRVKVTIEPGDTDFDDVYACGRDRIRLEVIQLDRQPYYIHGDWMLYGFRHMCDWEHWKTELLLSRIEYNATGRGI